MTDALDFPTLPVATAAAAAAAYCDRLRKDTVSQFPAPTTLDDADATLRPSNRTARGASRQRAARRSLSEEGAVAARRQHPGRDSSTDDDVSRGARRSLLGGDALRPIGGTRRHRRRGGRRGTLVRALEQHLPYAEDVLRVRGEEAVRGVKDRGEGEESALPHVVSDLFCRSLVAMDTILHDRQVP